MENIWKKVHMVKKNFNQIEREKNGKAFRNC